MNEWMDEFSYIDYEMPLELNVSTDGQISMWMDVTLGHHTPTGFDRFPITWLAVSFSIQDFQCQCFTEPEKGKQMTCPGLHSH